MLFDTALYSFRGKFDYDCARASCRIGGEVVDPSILGPTECQTMVLKLIAHKRRLKRIREDWGMVCTQNRQQYERALYKVHELWKKLQYRGSRVCIYAIQTVHLSTVQIEKHDARPLSELTRLYQASTHVRRVTQYPSNLLVQKSTIVRWNVVKFQGVQKKDKRKAQTRS